MVLNYNQNGNLHETFELDYGEVKKHFGFSKSRLEKLKVLITYLKIFRSFGCTEIYIVGSFVSKKIDPNDIDVCVNMTDLDYAGFKKSFPDFFKERGIETINNVDKCHFIFFDTYSLEILEWFKYDKENNPKGLLKISLFDINRYDHK